MPDRERSLTIRLSLLLGAAVGTWINTWWFVLALFLITLFATIYDAVEERRD